MPTAVKPETEEQRVARIKKEVAAEVPNNRPEDPTLAKAIDTARERLERKAAILAEVQNSRQLTTLLIGDNLGSRDQVEWVKTYLPRKARKAGEAEEVAE